MAGELAGAVVSHLDFALLARLDGFLGVLRNGAATRSNSLVDNQGLVACVGEGEGCRYYRSRLRELAKVVNQLVELDFGLSRSEGDATDEHHRCKYKFLHNSFLIFTFLLFYLFYLFYLFTFLPFYF